MVHTSTAEKILFGLVIAMTFGSVVLLLFGTVMGINENFGEGTILIFIPGILMTAGSITILVFFIKKLKCNKMDGTMMGFTCNIPALK